MSISAGLYFSHLLGFSLQIVPATVLLLLPFSRTQIKGARSSFIILTLFLLLDCIIFPFPSLCFSDRDSNFLSNLYMLVSVSFVVVLWWLRLAETGLRKFLILFTTIFFSIIQFMLAYVIMEFIPAAKDGYVYDASTIISYVIVSSILFPPVACFFRGSLRRFLPMLKKARSSEFVYLIILCCLYLATTIVSTSFWQSSDPHLPLANVYYAAMIFLLTGALFLAFLNTISLSVLRSKKAETELAAAISRESYRRITGEMEDRRRAMHDTRHLLNEIRSIAESGSRDDLRTFVDEALGHMQTVNTQFSSDDTLNSILQYYAAEAASKDVSLTVDARVYNLSAVRDSDLTILLGNMLENAIRSTADYQHKKRSPLSGVSDNVTTSISETKSMQTGIQVKISADNNLLLIRVSNPCLSVARQNTSIPADADGFLPGSAFASTTGSGYGLSRIESIAEAYHGNAGFRFDETKECFITRVSLLLQVQD